MDIKIEGNLLDYIDEDELKNEIRSSIKYQISKILSDDAEVKKVIISSIVNEIKDITFTKQLEDALKLKIQEIIESEYINGDSFHIKYDAKIPEKVQEIFDNNRDSYLPILTNKMEEAVRNYEPDTYVIADITKDLLLEDESSKKILIDCLQDRLCDIIEKI